MKSVRPTLKGAKTIDLRKLQEEARRREYVESGQKAKDEKDFYDAMVALVKADKK